MEIFDSFPFLFCPFLTTTSHLLFISHESFWELIFLLFFHLSMNGLEWMESLSSSWRTVNLTSPHHPKESISRPVSKPCSQMICLFGAKCKERPGRKAQCVCDELCNPHDSGGNSSSSSSSSPYHSSSSSFSSSSSSSSSFRSPSTPSLHHSSSLSSSASSTFPNHFGEVCGSDGVTYGNECHLKLYSCRIQESIIPLSTGPCKSKKEKKKMMREIIWLTEEKLMTFLPVDRVVHSPLTPLFLSSYFVLITSPSILILSRSARVILFSEKRRWSFICNTFHLLSPPFIRLNSIFFFESTNRRLVLKRRETVIRRMTISDDDSSRRWVRQRIKKGIREQNLH